MRRSVDDEVDIAGSDAIPPALAAELRARDITVIGLAPGTESPGGDEDFRELVAVLERWVE